MFLNGSNLHGRGGSSYTTRLILSTVLQSGEDSRCSPGCSRRCERRESDALSLSLSVCLAVYHSVCLSLSVSVCPPTVSVSLSVCLSVGACCQTVEGVGGEERGLDGGEAALHGLSLPGLPPDCVSRPPERPVEPPRGVNNVPSVGPFRGQLYLFVVSL